MEAIVFSIAFFSKASFRCFLDRVAPVANSKPAEGDRLKHEGAMMGARWWPTRWL